MPTLKLTLACWDYDRTRPLIDGRVQPQGIDLDITILRPRQAFQRMLEHREFEVSELSLASYAALKGRGECPFVAIPVALRFVGGGAHQELAGGDRGQLHVDAVGDGLAIRRWARRGQQPKPEGEEDGHGLLLRRRGATSSNRRRRSRTAR